MLLRLAVYENASGGTNFEYDLPSTQFGLFRNAQIDEVSKKLDARLISLIEKISSWPREGDELPIEYEYAHPDFRF